jgi:hypothetical protein
MRIDSLRWNLSLCALLLAAQPASATEVEVAEPSHCASLLSSAFEDLGRAGSSQWVGLFEEAFETCAPAELPPDELALYYRGHGEYLGLHKKDYAAAVAAYEDGLQRVDALVGRDDPIRIALLDGLANALEVAAQRDQSQAPARDRQRAIQLLRESIQIRQEAFGEDSAEAVDGWCRLAYSHLEASAALAETYARDAVRAGRRSGDAEAIRDSLSCLLSTLEEQGKTDEAAEVREQALAAARSAS